MTCSSNDVLDLVSQLEETTQVENPGWTTLKVAGQTLGYLWEPTGTVGLKQTLAEQHALVSERPDVFEVQFTTSSFGWVVVHLARIDRDELAELVFEPWRLAAPHRLARARSDVLPR